MSRKNNKVLKDFEPTLTKQSFKDECNINNIVAKFAITGQLPQSSRKPRYMDCVGVDSYQDALAIVDLAAAHFSALPAKVRARFANDPVKMVAFLEDPNNAEEAIKLGLAEPKNAPANTPEEAKPPTV
jgi:phage internal scaffolding protein